MLLTKLVDNTPPGLADVDIKGVSSDSRAVRDGWLFAALRGSRLNGADYIKDAIRNGAVAVLVSSEEDLPEDIKNAAGTIIYSDNPRHDYSIAMARFYRIQPENIACVTGTSGKTSSVAFVQQLLKMAGCGKVASIGTLGVCISGGRDYMKKNDFSMTTPDPESLYAELADMAASSIRYLAMEASSHGIEQGRLDGVRMKVAAFTNLSRDHLDYHKDMDSYFKAKSRLFSELLPDGGIAVLNADDERFEELQKICVKRGIKTISYGEKGYNIKLVNVLFNSSGQEMSITVCNKDYTLVLPLLGGFQVMNALCALGVVMALFELDEKAPDIDKDEIPALLERLQGVPGRLERVPGHPKGAGVYVDYAHKPAALESILDTVRLHTQGKVVCLFGCGGNRDVGKRKIMGKIAARKADIVVVTDDNPRFEDAAAIRKQIIEGAGGLSENVVEIPDRGDAISYAVELLDEGDVLVIAGKGHETGQKIGDRVEYFNDFEFAKTVIEGMKRA